MCGGTVAGIGQDPAEGVKSRVVVQPYVLSVRDEARGLVRRLAGGGLHDDMLDGA